MEERISQEETDKAQFVSLVIMLSSAAMRHLGKMMNPLDGKVEVSLDAARGTIDVLLMLSSKTKGNLDAEEDRLLKQTLSTLQLNFVETAQKTPAKPAENKPEPSGEAPGKENADADGAGPGDVNIAGGKSSRDPKFHKAY